MSDKKRKNAKIGDEIEFKWLKRRGRAPGDKDVCFYQSFMFDGVEYSLYDCVYLFKRGQSEPYVGKLVRIWGNAKTEERKVKVLWFFRPSEISNYLQGVNVLKNEIFLGTGVGPGLTNINPLEAIAGKCNVMCISKDDRNRQPSNGELELADYVFYRTFDVKNLSISDKLDEKIAMIDVELLLNKKNLQSVDLAKLDSANVTADVKSLISAKDDVAADTLVDVANNSVLVAGVEKTGTPNKVTEDSDRDVKFDAGVGSLLGYEKKQLTEKGDVATNENSSVVPSTSGCVLGSGQQINSKSSDSKQTELNKVGEGTVTVTATENGKPEPKNDVKKRTVVADKDKAKSEDRPSKKLKLDVTAKKSIVSGTKKSVNVSPASNNVLRSVACAAEIADGGKLISESESISGTPLGKQKFNRPANGKSGDRPDEKVSVKQSKDKDLDNCVSKAPHRPGGAAESKDRVKLLRERDGTSEEISKKRRTNNFSEHQSTNKLGKEIKQHKDEEDGGYAQVKEVTLPPLDKTKWFTTEGLWEDRINGANDQGKLVLLQNLDPTYSANEVQGIILDGFHESCTVKIVQHTATSSPHAGQAFAIFSNREVAAMVMRKLEQGCLMLPNGRPLVGTNYSMTLHGKQSQYFGHIVIEKNRQQKQKDMREAVSTSHSSQSNTLEYEMALEWQLLQDRSDLCWKYLYQDQGNEMRKLNAQLKSKK